MLTVGGSESVLTLVGGVVGLGGKQRLVVSFLELDCVRTRDCGRLDHFFCRLEITLVVGPNFCNNVGRRIVGDGGFSEAERADRFRVN